MPSERAMPELEAENERLKQQISTLREALEDLEIIISEGLSLEDSPEFIAPKLNKARQALKGSK